MNVPVLSDLETRKALGKSSIDENKLEEALEIYAAILEDYPDDFETYVILGDLYLAKYEVEVALQFYRYAQNLVPGHKKIKDRIQLALADLPKNSDLDCDPIPTNREAIKKLLQSLLKRQSPVSEAEINRASVLLEKIIHSPNPAQAVEKHLDEIDELLPALLEINIRQAKSDGRPDIAFALEELLQNIHLQIMGTKQAGERYSGFTRNQIDLSSYVITILQVEDEDISPRALMTIDCLQATGLQVNVQNTSVVSSLENIDLVLAFNPHTSEKVMESLAVFASAKIPIVIDFDNDFEQLPIFHDDYQKSGLGSPKKARAYSAALYMAKAITVPGELMAVPLREAGFPVWVIPDTWSKKNPLWEKENPARHAIHLGWIQSPSELEDIIQIRRMVIRTLREFPHTRLVTYGDPQVYKLFDSIHENRRIFLPKVSYEDYPYVLSQIDILLVPLRNTPFNQAQSNRILMEAGIKNIPWIASPVLAFKEWYAGGIQCSSPDEWHTYMRQLVLDQQLRTTLGSEGRLRAEKQETGHVAKIWTDIFIDILKLTI